MLRGLDKDEITSPKADKDLLMDLAVKVLAI